MQREFEIGGRRVEVRIAHSPEGMRLTFNGRERSARLRALGDGEFLLELDGATHRLWLAANGDETFIHLDGRSWCVRALEGEAGGTGSGGAAREDTVTAPMPGVVLSVHVGEGEAVQRGQPLLVIESMKMETTIAAWRDGVVAKLHCGKGDTFNRKAPLVTLEPARET